MIGDRRIPNWDRIEASLKILAGIDEDFHKRDMTTNYYIVTGHNYIWEDDPPSEDYIKNKAVETIMDAFKALAGA